jgi:hypothetical protein
MNGTNLTMDLISLAEIIWGLDFREIVEEMEDGGRKGLYILF